MTKILRGVTIDNGGSEVRVLPYGEKADSDKMIKVSNNFISIPESEFRIRDVADATQLVRVLEAPKREYVGIMATGLTGKSYDGESIAINNQEPKTSSLAYYRQFIFAVAMDALTGYKEHSKTFTDEPKRGFFGSSNNPSRDFSYLYAIVTCIPIKEHSGLKDCAQKLKDSVKGTYVVEFPLLEDKPVIKFTIDERFMGVVPEGGVAITALRKVITDDDISLIVDMGHITTDIALFQGKSLLGKVVSSPYAGSTLIGNVRAALNDEGFYLSEEQTAKVLETGRARKGATEIDVTATIKAQKELFVRNYLKKEIIQVFNMNAINAAQIQNFIPIGAAMNDYKGESAMQKLITEACGLNYAKVHLLSNDLRYVNIEQASNFTAKMVAKAKSCLETVTV